MSSDVITIDSGDEGTDESPIIPVAGDSSASFHDSIAAGPADTNHLNQPSTSVVFQPVHHRQNRLPLPPAMVPGVAAAGRGRGAAMAYRPPVIVGNARMPKRPGQFPPFALFSQEERPKLQESNPALSFAELGRQLGEMWHGLSEDAKDNYRKRARAIQEKKIRFWEAQQKQIRAKQMASAARGGGMTQPQQFVPRGVGRPPAMVQQGRGRGVFRQQPAMNAYQGPGGGGMIPGGRPKKRMHGYAIFSNERKKYYASLGLDVTQATERVAAEWRNASLKVKQNYEMRARKYNLQQEANAIRMGGGGGGQKQPQQQPRLPPSTSLRIANVSSLAPAPSSSNLSSNINLPSSISISRVEPEVSILSEQPAVPRPYQLPASTQVSMQRPAQQQQQRRVMVASAPVHRKPQYNPNQLVTPQVAAANMRGRMMMQRGSFVGARGGGGRGIIGNRAGALTAVMPMRPGIKRPAGVMMHHHHPQMAGGGGMMMAKRPRVTTPAMDPLRLGPALSPTQLINRDKFCRLCATLCTKCGPVYSLAKLPELCQKIRRALGCELNLEKDEMEGYPGVICRRCSHTVSAFEDFKMKTVEGNAKIGRILALREKSTNGGGGGSGSNSSSPAPPPAVSSPTIIVEAAAPEDADEVAPESEVSILPDLDMDIDAGPVMVGSARPMQIKEEKHAGIPTVAFAEVVEDKKPQVAEGGGEKEKSEITADKKEEAKEQGGESVQTPENGDNAEDDNANDGEVDPLTSTMMVLGDPPKEGDGGDASATAAEENDDGFGFDAMSFVQVAECQSLDEAAFQDNDGQDDDGEGEHVDKEENGWNSSQQEKEDEEAQWTYDRPADVEQEEPSQEGGEMEKQDQEKEKESSQEEQVEQQEQESHQASQEEKEKEEEMKDKEDAANQPTNVIEKSEEQAEEQSESNSADADEKREEEESSSTPQEEEIMHEGDENQKDGCDQEDEEELVEEEEETEVPDAQEETNEQSEDAKDSDKDEQEQHEERLVQHEEESNEHGEEAEQDSSQLGDGADADEDNLLNSDLIDEDRGEDDEDGDGGGDEDAERSDQSYLLEEEAAIPKEQAAEDSNQESG